MTEFVAIPLVLEHAVYKKSFNFSSSLVTIRVYPKFVGLSNQTASRRSGNGYHRYKRHTYSPAV